MILGQGRSGRGGGRGRPVGVVWVGAVRVRMARLPGWGPTAPNRGSPESWEPRIVGARRVGAPKGGGGRTQKKWRPERWWPAGVSHDSPRTPNVHITGSGRFRHSQNSTRRPPREGRKSENGGGRGKKERNFSAVWRIGVRGRGPG